MKSQTDRMPVIAGPRHVARMDARTCRLGAGGAVIAAPVAGQPKPRPAHVPGGPSGDGDPGRKSVAGSGRAGRGAGDRHRVMSTTLVRAASSPGLDSGF